MAIAGIATIVMAAFAAFMGYRFPVDPEAVPHVWAVLIRKFRKQLYGLAAIFLVVGLIEIFFL
jgi:hypothetical protein